MQCALAWPAAYNLLISGLMLLGHGCPAVTCGDAACGTVWSGSVEQRAPHELHIIPMWCLIRSSVPAAITNSQIPAVADAVAFQR